MNFEKQRKFSRLFGGDRRTATDLTDGLVMEMNDGGLATSAARNLSTSLLPHSI